MASFDFRVDGRAIRDAQAQRRKELERKTVAEAGRRPLDPLSAGRWLLALTLAATAMHLFAGYMSFELLTNPTILNVTSTFETPAPPVEDQSLYVYLGAVAGILNIVFLLVAAIKGKAGSLPLTVVVLIQFFFLGYGILFPLVREVLLFGPPAVVLLAMCRTIRPDSPHLNKLRMVGYLTFWPAIMLEPFMLGGKAYGAVFLYASTLLLGMATLALGIYAREDHYLKMGRDAPSSRPPAPPYPAQVPSEAVLEDRGEAPATPPSPPRRMNPAVTLCVAGALLLIIFMPPLQELASGPKLEIYWNQRSGDSDLNDQHTAPVPVDVEAWVINRGAGAASGAIRLVVRNDTLSFDIGSTDSISGFGNWHVKTHIELAKNRAARRNVTIHLYIDDRPVDVRLMRTPGFEAVAPLAAAVLIKAFVEFRRKRDD